MQVTQVWSAVQSALRGPWLRKGVWTLMDQSLFAGANFLVNVLLARWLTPEGYGAYTVAYTVFLLLGTIHSGFLVEPMLVYGASRFDSRLERYLRVLLSAHGKFSLGAAVLFAIGATYFWTSGQLILGHALAAFAVGQALILFQWMMRSACYIRTQPFLAATTGMVYAGLMIAGVSVLNHYGWLNEATGIGLMAGASLAAGTLMAFRLGIPAARVEDPVLARDALAKHREYGGWAASTGALEWFHGFLPFLLLPLWFGLAETGALRALFNLVLPVLHIFHALAHLLVPIFVRARLDGTQRRVAVFVGSALTVLTLVYALAVEFGGTWVMHLLYDGKYDEYLHLLWIVAVLPIVLAFSNIAQALLRSQERPEAVFAARGAASVVAASLGAASVFFFGVMGALISDLLTAFTESAIMLGLLKRGVGPVESTGAHDAAPHPDRKHVLMVAFACGPGRGSEPGQGWQFARRIAAHHDVTALVYAGFRRVLEAELSARPMPGLRIVYYRLPLENARHHAHGEDRHGLREQIHYHLWNLGAGRLARRLHEERPFDLAHHVSLMRYWSPSAGAALYDVPLVWGPVGGGESAPAPFYRSFSAAGRRFERLRDTVRWGSRLLPSVRRTARHAVVGLATTRESAKAMERLGAPAVTVATASVALDGPEIERLGALPLRSGGPLRFVAIGRLLHWKGYDLALRAFALAREQSTALADAEFWIAGDGPEHAYLAALAESLGVADRVTLLGDLPRTECLDRMTACDVLVHPSFHDSGGYATLEGMAAGRPVVCLALGGPALQVTPEVGIAVEAHTPAQVEADLARAFVRLAEDDGLRARMGAAGRARVAEVYTWDRMVEEVLALYPVALRAEAAWGDTLGGAAGRDVPDLALA